MYNFLPHKLAANALFDATNEHPATLVHTHRTAASAPVWHISRPYPHLLVRVITSQHVSSPVMLIKRKPAFNYQPKLPEIGQDYKATPGLQGLIAFVMAISRFPGGAEGLERLRPLWSLSTWSGPHGLVHIWGGHQASTNVYFHWRTESLMKYSYCRNFYWICWLLYGVRELRYSRLSHHLKIFAVLIEQK